MNKTFMAKEINYSSGYYEGDVIVFEAHHTYTPSEIVSVLSGTYDNTGDSQDKIDNLPDNLSFATTELNKGIAVHEFSSGTFDEINNEIASMMADSLDGYASNGAGEQWGYGYVGQIFDHGGQMIFYTQGGFAIRSYDSYTREYIHSYNYYPTGLIAYSSNGLRVAVNGSELSEAPAPDPDPDPLEEEENNSSGGSGQTQGISWYATNPEFRYHWFNELRPPERLGDNFAKPNNYYDNYINHLSGLPVINGVWKDDVIESLSDPVQKHLVKTMSQDEWNEFKKGIVTTN